jgi:hypothetical protein
MVPKSKECGGGYGANGGNHPNPGMTPFRIISADHAGMQAFQISPGRYANAPLTPFPKNAVQKSAFLEHAGSEK